MLKRLLNAPERITYDRLTSLCLRRSAQVYAKVRLADVLPIEGSGLSDDLFAFALQAHYDFVVTDREQRPLFAVEFDGPTHDSSEQAGRDVKKDALSRLFELPLMRIQTADLHRSEMRLDRLSEMAERWFDEKIPASEHRVEVAATAPLVASSNQFADQSCPLCGAGLIKKPGKYGLFLSCVRFPECRGSRDLPGRPTPPRHSVDIEMVQIRPAWIISILIACMVLVGMMTAFFAMSEKDHPRLDEPASSIVRNEPIPERKSTARGSDRATTRQINLLNLLIQRRGWDAARLDAESHRVLGYQRSQSDLSKQEASRLITAWDDRKK